MDIRIFISRAAAFLISYPFFLGVPFIFAYRMEPVLFPLLGMNWWLVPTSLIVFFATLAPLAYGQIRSKMENAFLAEQKRYQKLLLQAASGMATEHDLNRLAKLIVYIVKKAVRIDFAAIFLDDKSNEIYRLKAYRDRGSKISKDMVFLYEHPLVQYLKKQKEPVLYEELPPELRESLGEFSKTSLIVPSGIEDNLLGFVFFGEKLNRQPYTNDDIDVFKILSHQAALAIENCLFMEESRQAQEKIFAAEKLASIGGIADGVAHQIKNRLNQFSVASGELRYEIKDFAQKHSELILKNPDLKKTFDYLAEIATSFLNNVKRTDGIVKGILNFARVEEKETFFSKFSLKEVIDVSTELLQIKHEISQVPLKLNLGSSDIIYGVKAQMTEVVYNMLDNAYEAIQDKVMRLEPEEKLKFSPEIKLRLLHEQSIDVIEISDNGIGVSKENERKIFAPFFTTKSSYKSGTGIGMYVVKRMVEENHKGKVWFESTHMKGIKFFVELPRK
ncbi:MAG: ATP-binding protein [Candidatus Omnitrophica bacterium]|nr:ATP-binding protein [Candidatus Omnitrophota bacterium]MDD5430413.1 ATP-binding protein [Candidatus Omnitrophota bacterium]